MKKMLTATVLGLSLLGLAACSDGSSKEDTKGAMDPQTSQILTVDHADVRADFDKISMASVADDFSGGTNLETLKSYFGEPSSTSQEQAGDATLDVYNWQFDSVLVNAKLYNDSAVVKSISNFSYVRDPKITLKDYDELANGTSYDAVVNAFGVPDVYSIAVSSDSTMTQALWSSNLVTPSGTSGSITLNFENGNLSSKTQSNLANK